jgi:hypothetical protein
MKAKRKTRKEMRSERAELVCREVRYQLAEHGVVNDSQAVLKHINKWMRVAKKVKYKRP